VLFKSCVSLPEVFDRRPLQSDRRCAGNSYIVLFSKEEAPSVCLVELIGNSACNGGMSVHVVGSMPSQCRAYGEQEETTT
jgi:hypothetical protein